MPFPGERLVPRGSKKSWEIAKESRVDEFNMRVRAFTNGETERLDVEILEDGIKRRLFSHEGPDANARGEGFVAGYAAGRATLKALTPQPKSKTNKKVARP